MLLLAVALRPAGAATVLEQTIRIEIGADGIERTTERLRVRLDAAEDLEAWSPYAIPFDENGAIEALEARAIRPNGEAVRVPRKDIDTSQVSESGILHSSLGLRTVTFPSVPPGSILEIDSTRRERPYFPGGLLDLGAGRDPIQSLSVQIRGPGELRHRIEGDTGKLTVEASPGALRITGRDLPAERDLDAAPSRIGPVLRYAWGGGGDWRSVAAWWEELLRQVPRAADEVRREAQRITGSLPTTRQKLEALVAFAQRDVRYVAVEVGVGGYRPHGPGEVLARKWGDCKDKALLLADLLGAVGIEAYPALVRLDSGGRVDRDFPSPFDFNHMIVAVSAAGLDLGPGAPVAGGYLFVDATQTIGSSLAWLPPPTQDQEALVVRGERAAQSELIRTPILPAGELEALTVDAVLDAQGGANGQARLELSGWSAAAIIEGYEENRAAETETALRQLLADLLPGVRIADLSWQPVRASLPKLTVAARVELPNLVSGASWAFQATSLTATPAAGILDERTVPVVLTPSRSRTIWRLKLPDGLCPPAAQDASVDTAIGTFRQTLQVVDGQANLERSTEVRQRWIAPADFAALRDLALAEHRAEKRRVRLACGG